MNSAKCVVGGAVGRMKRAQDCGLLNMYIDTVIINLSETSITCSMGFPPFMGEKKFESSDNFSLVHPYSDQPHKQKSF